MKVAEGLGSDRMFRHTHPRLRASTAPGNKNEKSSQHYLNAGKSFVEQQSKKEINRNVARNVILYLGDGMSAPTLSAARMYMGGEEKSLSFEKFPFVGMSKTYCVNKQVADSACSATGQQNSMKCVYFLIILFGMFSAYLGGVKGNAGTIGVNAKVKRSRCRAQIDASTRVLSIAKWALDAGKSIGLVTTARVTHASPAGRKRPNLFRLMRL